MQSIYAEKDWVNPEGNHLICLTNGTLEPDTGQIRPHSANDFLTGKLDIAWDKDAQCPRWTKFLDEVFAGDMDAKQKIQFVQEWFGYCLVPDTSQHKFVWLVGSGGNGKSVLIDVLSAMIGKENISNAQVQKFDKDFVRAELEGKLLNVSAEMTAEATLEGSYLKQIVAGDAIQAERKFQPSFSFRPYARIVAATNELPRLLDLSDGFARRAVILTFNRQFKAQDQDRGLTKKLLEELPGILVWAVKGLQSLKARGEFEIPSSSQDTVNRYRTESDAIQLFCQENLVADEAGKVAPADIYELYRRWSQENGYKTMTSGTLGKNLARLRFTKRSSNSRDYWKVRLVFGPEQTNKTDSLPGLETKYTV